MKQQSQFSNINHDNVYDDSKPTHERYAKAIKDAAQGCWWVEQYLRGVYYTRTKEK